MAYKNKEDLRRYQREWGRRRRALHPEKAWAKRNPEAANIYARSWRKRNPDKHALYARTWRNKTPENQETSREANRQSYARHASKRAAYARVFRALRKADPIRYKKYLEWARKRAQWRVANDPIFALRKRIRTRILMALKYYKKGGRTTDLLGCSIQTAKAHIESLWKPGMSWENYGVHGWHLDHKTPCDSFNLADVEEQKKCFHYTNLQPLWAFENLSKGPRRL